MANPNSAHFQLAVMQSMMNAQFDVEGKQGATVQRF
jgi:hypothetical protein